MRHNIKKYWFRIVLLATIMVPALLTQTVHPMLSFDQWEALSDRIYAELLAADSKPESDPSKIVIIEVDKPTIESFGWPVNRKYFTQLFRKLKDSGHPYVLSMTPFQALHKSTTFNQTEFKKLDEELASTISDYGRVIGASLRELEGQELSSYQEEQLMPRIALSSNQTPPEELPYLPMHLTEDNMYIEGQLAFGFPTATGPADIKYCSQMFITDKAFSGSFVIPSSMTWLAAYMSGRGFKTSTGAAWPRIGEDAEVRNEKPLEIGYRHCVSSPQVSTGEFFEQRSVNKYSMVHMVNGSTAVDLSGKAVILALEDTNNFKGPGRVTKQRDNAVKEYQFMARLLDDMMTGRYLRREPLEHNALFSRLPFYTSAALVILSFFGLTRLIMLTASILCAVGLGISYLNLNNGVFSVPVQMLVYCAATLTLIAGLHFWLRIYDVLRQLQFSEKLRGDLAQCNTIFEIEAVCQKVLSEEFLSCDMRLEGFDRELYQAANDAKAALKFLDNSSNASADLDDKGERTAMGWITRKLNLKRILRQELDVRVQQSIISEKVLLGQTSLKITLMAHERRFVTMALETLRHELRQHWKRVKLLVDQKLLDYKILREQTRSDILARFLTHTLVSRFSNKMTMEENLGLVLTPRPTKAALMQADIRGYSRISAQLAPKEMVELLRNYYKNVVDAAQMVAQVKLIGDCIFLFVEESEAKADMSPVDICLELASILVSETNKQNQLRIDQKAEPMFFGVAIHYGDVVVGNLSSDSCIDYTAIGPNVNLVARLEEMTKHHAIARLIGKNGTIISTEAIAALKKHNALTPQKLDLNALRVSVRSFTQVDTVYGLTATDIEIIDTTQFRQFPTAG